MKGAIEMSIMGSIYTNPSELGSDYWKERAETYLHDQELYRKECDTLRKQLDILKQAILDHKDDLIFPKEWCDDALAEIEKVGKDANEKL